MSFSRSLLWQLLRDEPRSTPALVTQQSEARDDLFIERLRLRFADGETVRGLLTRPAETAGRRPAILFLHSHGGHYDVGADELLDGQDYIGAYGPIFARAGYVTLAIDMPLFGDRRQFTEDALSKALLWRGRTLMGQMLAELSGALSYLAGRPDVDPARVGAFGMSMGCTHGFMLTALDDRIRAVAHLCCFADYGVLIEQGAHDGHGHYMTIPGLVAAMSTGEICGAIAPRPQLICLGAADPLTPPEAVAKARAETETAYAAAGHPERLGFVIEPGVGHQETPAMRDAVLRFFAENL
jgi:dienelactone hydrolase